MMEVAVTTGAIGRAKLQSNHHHQQTNTKSFYRPDALPGLFTGQMPFLSPNQQCQSTEGNTRMSPFWILLELKDDGGGDSWCKSSPTTSQHPTFYRPDAIPVADPPASISSSNYR